MPNLCSDKVRMDASARYRSCFLKAQEEGRESLSRRPLPSLRSLAAAKRAQAAKAKLPEYNLNGFKPLEDGLSLSMLKEPMDQSDPKQVEAYDKLYINIAANATYCTEIMNAEMDRLGIKDAKTKSDLPYKPSKNMPKKAENDESLPNKTPKLSK